MALLQLLGDLSRLHHWQLHHWHGDHGWHSGSSITASALADWMDMGGRSLLLDRADPASAEALGEDGARRWRYARLLKRSRELNCSHVVTGHTASDRAETLVMNLARGSHRRGLASLRPCRPLAERQLVRPLLIFSRRETADIARAWALPIWHDPSNDDLSLERNRLRSLVMPVLDELHPGVERRLAGLAERLAEDEDSAAELTALALAPLLQKDGSLNRTALLRLSSASQRRLVLAWLEPRTPIGLKARQLDTVLARLAQPARSGTMDLADGWRLQWCDQALRLVFTSRPPATARPATHELQPDHQGP